MKKRLLHLLFVFSLTSVLLNPATVRADEGDDHAYSVPTVQATALGFIDQQGLTPSEQVFPAVAQADSPPTGSAPTDSGAEGVSALVDNAEMQLANQAIFTAPGLTAEETLNTCVLYNKNGGFETVSDWSLYPTANVKYSPYPLQGTRSLYMTTAGNTNGFAWQLVAIPNNITSLWVRYRAWQNMEPGETAWVSIWNANNTQRLWWQQITYTQGMWFDQYAWLNAASYAGRNVNFMFEIYTDGDASRSDIWLDQVEIGGCTTAAPQPEPAVKNIDLTISLYRTASTADREAYRNIMRWASDVIYEMSNGKHRLGKVTFYQNWPNQFGGLAVQNTHVHWYPCHWPNANLGGYLRVGSERINMGDYWPRIEDKKTYRKTTLCTNGTYLLSNQKTAGYVFAHELGHFFYGLGDEYAQTNFEKGVPSSVMNNQGCAITPTSASCAVGGTHPNPLMWLNFSTRNNFTGPNTQYNIYRISAWDTLVRNPASDNLPFINGRPQRPFYPELASVYPTGPWPTIELAANHTSPCQVAAACQGLDVRWENVVVSQSTVEDNPFYAQVIAKPGTSVTYPQPVVLVAQVSTTDLIAGATLTAHVAAPNGTQSALAFRDDGLGPDDIAGDGQYSVILPYYQNGAHTVNVTFTNPNNQARLTSIGLMDADWVLGDLIGTNFTAAASTTVQISGYAADDHADGFASATQLFTDNQPKAGQIDRAGDKDVFKIDFISDGLHTLRITHLGLDIQPRLRFWDKNQTTLLGDFTIIPEPNMYYYVHILADAGHTIYLEVLHANGQAAQGLYQVSTGRPLAGEGSFYKAYIPQMQR